MNLIDDQNRTPDLPEDERDKKRPNDSDPAKTPETEDSEQESLEDLSFSGEEEWEELEEDNGDELSEDSDPETTTFEDLPPEMQNILESVFGPSVRDAQSIVISSGDMPDGFDFDGSSTLSTITTGGNPVEDIKNEEEYIKEYVLPQLDREIQSLQQRKAYIAGQYGIKDEKAGGIAEASPLTPSQRAELKERVIFAESYLPSVIKGQDHAIATLIRSLKRAVAGTRDSMRPIASVLELGPTGVGKTLTAKELAGVLKVPDSEISFDFLKIDCSEYSQGHETGRLKGAPPGYIGYDDGSQLEAVQKNPYHVVLLDEIEKASKEMHNLLLQILEDGEATLGNGQKVSFRNCIIIMTSNVGVSKIKSARNPMKLTPGTGALDHSAVERETEQALKEEFAPEFLNRIDEIIGFNEITVEVAREIAINELNKLKVRTEQNNPGTSVVIEPGVVEQVVQDGFSVEFGARNIRRTVEKKVASVLSDALFELDEAELAVSIMSIGASEGEVTVTRSARDVAIPDADSLH